MIYINKKNNEFHYNTSHENSLKVSVESIMHTLEKKHEIVFILEAKALSWQTFEHRDDGMRSAISPYSA